jgi:vitamin B12 transporter
LVPRAASWVVSCALVCSAPHLRAQDDYRAHAHAELGERPDTDDATAASTRIDVGADASLRSLGELVAQVPGARVANTGGLGAYSTLSLRGADFDETLVLLEEIPLVGPDGGAFDLGLLPASLFESIEVYRGGAPVWLGSGAIGGVLRLLPKRVQQSSAELSVSAGSFNTQVIDAGAQVMNDSGLGVRSQAVVRRTDGDFPYRDDNGTRFDATDDVERLRRNAQLNDASGLLDLALPVPFGSLHVVALALGRTGGFPGPGSQPTPAVHRQLLRALSGLSFEHVARRDRELLQRVQLVASLAFGADRFTDLYGQLGTSKQTASDDRSWRGFLRAALTQRLVHGLETTLVTSYAADSFSPHDALAFPAPAPSGRQDWASAAELRWFGKLGSLRAELRPSLRLEWSHTDIHAREGLAGPIDSSVERLAPTARAGGLLEVWPGVTLSASLASGTRLPTMFELFGDRALVRPSPSLRPVKSRSVDGGLMLLRQLGALRVQAELRGFYQRREDSIAAYRTAQFQVGYENLSAVRQWGIESGLSLVLGEYASLNASFTWLQTENALGKRLPFRPEYVTYARPEAHVQWTDAVVSRAGVFAELSHRTFAYVDRVNLSYVDPCLTLGAGAFLELLRKRVRLSASLADATDARCTDLIGYPLPGRSFLLSIAYQELPNET